jgi:hypothetical protein
MVSLLLCSPVVSLLVYKEFAVSILVSRQWGSRQWGIKRDGRRSCVNVLLNFHKLKLFNAGEFLNSIIDPVSKATCIP